MTTSSITVTVVKMSHDDLKSNGLYNAALLPSLFHLLQPILHGERHDGKLLNAVCRFVKCDYASFSIFISVLF